MPWNECNTMSERMKFVVRLESGDKMSDLCKEFDVSRKTGYKIWNRFKEHGSEAFEDQSRRPKRLANETSKEIQKLILDLKDYRKTWGAPKILERLKTQYPDLKLPARSTVHAILNRNGLVKKRGSARHRATGTNLEPTRFPNDLWCVDYKGQFKLGNKRYCYPLTISDHTSRFLLCCESLESTKAIEAIPVFKRIFEEYGLPTAIRSDNGVPFASKNYYGLSELSILWLKLGIKIERIEPGCPQQNGRHERMHKTLKADTTKPPGKNHLQQQETFDNFLQIYNTERPHEALQMKTPVEFYKASNKKYSSDLLDYDYSQCDRTYRVSLNGSFEPKRGHYVTLGKPFASEEVGVREIEEGLWQVFFTEYNLGYYDFYDKKFEKVPIL